MVIKGNILYMKDRDTLEVVEQGYLVIKDGLIESVLKEVQQIDQEEEFIDYGDSLIIPGMTDLHVHAPQYAFRGLGMDKELIDWLHDYAFCEEEKYENMDYARQAYGMFAKDLAKSFTTRACIFATIHREATEYLAEQLEKTGLITYLGKVNMDCNGSERLNEDTQISLRDTEWFVQTLQEKYKRTKPMLTPRFIPSCSDEMMQGIKRLQEKYQLPVQSHLSENPSEIEWVKELCPESKYYGDAYARYNLFGKQVPTIMAHCVYSPDAEIDTMKNNQVFVAHCPNSNTSLSSGIAPIRRYLEHGLQVGLGTDVAGGFSLSMFHAIRDAVSVSKLYWRLVDHTAKPLSSFEAFYLATMGGGSFFGKVGSFLPGFEADILVLSDENYPSPIKLSCQERLERLFYLAGDDVVKHKYVRGQTVEI